MDPAAGRLLFREDVEQQWLPNRVMEIGTSDYYLSIHHSALKNEFGHLLLRRILPSAVQGWMARMV